MLTIKILEPGTGQIRDWQKEQNTLPWQTNSENFEDLAEQKNLSCLVKQRIELILLNTLKRMQRWEKNCIDRNQQTLLANTKRP